eukprot:m.250300 g.250300  ORF g.250300 m.250300 type:complete len:84 (-) comp16633_c0_seq1:570-821(-)
MASRGTTHDDMERSENGQSCANYRVNKKARHDACQQRVTTKFECDPLIGTCVTSTAVAVCARASPPGQESPACLLARHGCPQA